MFLIISIIIMIIIMLIIMILIIILIIIIIIIIIIMFIIIITAALLGVGIAQPGTESFSCRRFWETFTSCSSEMYVSPED